MRGDGKRIDGEIPVEGGEAFQNESLEMLMIVVRIGRSGLGRFGVRRTATSRNSARSTSASLALVLPMSMTAMQCRDVILVVRRRVLD